MNAYEQIVDPFQVASSFASVGDAWLKHSEELKLKLADLTSRIENMNEEVLHHLPVTQAASEKDEAREEFMGRIRENAAIARRYYSLYSSWLRGFVAAVPGLGDIEKRRACFWTSQYLNAIAPANFFWTNPGAVQRFMDTEGASVAQGFINWMEDAYRGDNLLTIVDKTAFTVGGNIATTPGFVIYRNELMELIQYRPTTEATYSIPIVFIQPWINKFYIFDLSDENSFVRYLLDRGFTVFMISWKNPTPEMRSTTFEDYLFKGALKAIEVARDICKVNQVHAAGYCIGGTVLATAMAWLNRMWKEADPLPVADWSVFTSLVDFSEPGDIGVFTSEGAIGFIESLMKSEGGILDAKYISQAFRMLRSDGLVWRNYVHNYLNGGTPPKSDMLFWNDDGTRLPEAMCSFFLRNFYLQNKLVKRGEIVLGNCPMDLGYIEQPLYVVGAQQDHIIPWQGTFRTCKLMNCPVRYVLVSEGHIAGIVNPPSELSRKKHWAGPVDRNAISEPDEWLSLQPERRGSWWLDWSIWLIERNPCMNRPPSMGSGTYPPLEKAPGTYVLEP